ncbi:MAG TPA: hypothetical protein VIV60_21000 [Polyangiaceae bacterium]
MPNWPARNSFCNEEEEKPEEPAGTTPETKATKAKTKVRTRVSLLVKIAGAGRGNKVNSGRVRGNVDPRQNRSVRSSGPIHPDIAASFIRFVIPAPVAPPQTIQVHEGGFTLPHLSTCARVKSLAGR